MRLANERETMRRATIRFLSAVLFSYTLLGPRALAQDRAAVSRESTPSGAAALIGEVLSPRNRMEALLGTDNFDFLLEGVPNLVALRIVGGLGEREERQEELKIEGLPIG
jgi:hypothetical protein